MTFQTQNPKWVADRVDGIVGMLTNQQGFRDIHVSHTLEDKLLDHGFWFCTADFEENGSPLGFNRLTVQHPAGCECDVI